MERQQLINYLDTVCNVENALSACDVLIAKFNNALRNVPQPRQPIMPVKIVPNVHMPQMPSEPKFTGKSTSFFSEFIFTILDKWMFLSVLWPGSAIVIGCIIGFFYSLTHDDIPDDQVAIITIIIAVLSTIVTIIYCIRNSIDNVKEVERNNEIEKQQLATKYAQEKEQYSRALLHYENTVNEVAAQNESALVAYEMKKHAYDEAIKYSASIHYSLEALIEQQQNKRSDIVNQLNRLYQANIIYPRFHNRTAIYMIREYLKMGICQELEGPQGAYAQYMLDERTDRIASSISSMTLAITNEISALRQELTVALEEINRNLVYIGDDIARTNSTLSFLAEDIPYAMASLKNEMWKIQSASSADIDTRISEANHYLNHIEKLTEINAYNQYISNCMEHTYGISPYAM